MYVKYDMKKALQINEVRNKGLRSNKSIKIMK